MEKRCYVCGKIIPENTLYYIIGPNSYTCSNEKCFKFYYWDNLAARLIHDRYHQFAIINGQVYEIGSDDDEPRGFYGKHWTIRFNDGTYQETNSLWNRGKLPERLLPDFKDNAKFIDNKKGY